jgi:hypothetical protein
VEYIIDDVNSCSLGNCIPFNIKKEDDPAKVIGYNHDAE